MFCFGVLLVGLIMSDKVIFLPFKPSKIEESLFLDYLKKIYLDLHSPVAFSGPRAVLKHIKSEGLFTNIGLTRLMRYMGQFRSYTAGVSRRDAGKSRRYVNEREGHQLEIDLMIMTRFSKDNDDIKYLLVGIDTHSRMGYVEPLTSKHGPSVKVALQKMLGRVKNKIIWVHSDRGSEFVFGGLKSFLLASGIRQTISKQSGHGQLVERLIRSIRQLIRSYMVENGTQRYIDNLENLVNVYNSRTHSALDTSPNKINEYTSGFATDHQHSKWVERDKPKSFRFRVGDLVKLATDKTLFSKHLAKFTEEIFVVTGRAVKDKVNIYNVSGCKMIPDPIEGLFYERELRYVLSNGSIFQAVKRFISEEVREGQIHVLIEFNYGDRVCRVWLRKVDVSGI